ncbi:hypothetical protein EV182_003950, partial [Spiromyces aspiralis]
MLGFAMTYDLSPEDQEYIERFFRVGVGGDPSQKAMVNSDDAPSGGEDGSGGSDGEE